ncbi:hypothetical protein Bca52824_030772 [Brassica carinata]|uniref:DOMON domain-containing protein n=1 Tax=Brassica carinata TaxID=52824 RepID=A0A8X7V722_BRACI|nr:hypothetical protein Bca52824_030772 [Brassica carinata]
MAKSSILLLYLSVFFFIITKLALAQTCSNYKFSSNTLFESCNDLPVLDSFLHYTYDSSSSSLQIAYRHTNLTSKKWVAWAVNPTSTGMVGAQAIVAYPQSDGSLRAYTSAITSYQTSLREAGLSFNVSELSATYQNNEMIIFATLTLPLANGGNINTVWQDGSLSGNNLLSHPTSGNNIRSVFTMNLLSGASGGAAGGDSKLKKRNWIHGVFNAVSWGVMMPIGAIIARYLKETQNQQDLLGSDFYLHVLLLTSLVLQVGLQVSSWAGNQPGFSLALTVLSVSLSSALQQAQVQSLLDHHTIGYTVIILAVVTFSKEVVEKGLHRYNHKAVLEAFKWYVVIKRRKAEQSAETSQLGHGGMSQ